MPVLKWWYREEERITFKNSVLVIDEELRERKNEKGWREKGRTGINSTEWGT